MGAGKAAGEPSSGKIDISLDYHPKGNGRSSTTDSVSEIRNSSDNGIDSGSKKSFFRWRIGSDNKTISDDSDKKPSDPPYSRGRLITEVSAGTAASTLPRLARLCLKTLLGATVALYILNQKHLLPKPLGSVVSKALFWPTLPLTVSTRIGRWSTVVDETVLMGGAPFGFVGIPERLYHDFGVRGVVNLCEEYRGPTKTYDKLGIRYLWLPTVDHFEPSVDDIKKAVSFIRAHEAEGEKVYVHCRAGHGRSAAVVYAWLLYKDPTADPKELNSRLCSLRNVRKTLWKQASINEFRAWLKMGGRVRRDSRKKRRSHSRKGSKVRPPSADDSWEENDYEFPQYASEMDSEWSREEHEDSDAHVEYLTGDEWGDLDESPSFLRRLKRDVVNGIQKSFHDMFSDADDSESQSSDDDFGKAEDSGYAEEYSFSGAGDSGDLEDDRDYEMWQRYRER